MHLESSPAIKVWGKTARQGINISLNYEASAKNKERKAALRKQNNTKKKDVRHLRAKLKDLA